MREILKHCRRIVVKAGTSILTGPGGRISPASLKSLAAQIADLTASGKQTALVTSGAIAFGMDEWGLKQRPKPMARLQACAAVGQGKLMHAYEQCFSAHGFHTAQVLLTRDGLEQRARFINARRTLEELFHMRVIPIINENDTVATEEIAFGDNDILSIHVAHLAQADLLVLLSDVDGFTLRDGSRVRQVSSPAEIDRDLVPHLRDIRRDRTVGGMKAKLQASRLAMTLGVLMMIVHGHEKNILQRALAGEDVGTLFVPHAERRSARKKWIAYAASRKGTVFVDQGAHDALMTKQRSLLARGVVEVQGPFERGQVVELAVAGGQAFGRGVVRYSSRELALIAGKKSDEIRNVLGYKHHDEVIHRNDLVLWS